MKSEHRIVYIADDGTEFGDPVACERHEKLRAEVTAAMAGLGARTRHMSTGTYVQRDPNVVRTAAVALLTIICAHVDHRWARQALEDANRGTLLASGHGLGRLLDDAPELGLLANAWRRLACIDTSAREWDQPYFAAYPDEGTGPHAPAVAD